MSLTFLVTVHHVQRGAWPPLPRLPQKQTHRHLTEIQIQQLIANYAYLAALTALLWQLRYFTLTLLSNQIVLDLC